MLSDATDPVKLSNYRGYLQSLARTHFPTRYAGKLDPSDIVQQTLLNAHAAREQFLGQTEAERIAWLRIILLRNVAHATRDLHTKKRDIRREQSIDAAMDAAPMRLGDFLAAHQSSPSQQAVRHECDRRMADAIEGLTEIQRQVIMLRFWGGMSLQQLAETLGKSTPAAAGILHRATKKLRGLLGVALRPDAS